jgi:3-phenylpropionate/trans-cinnamate dioxygenase ferredoxin reductase subunit
MAAPVVIAGGGLASVRAAQGLRDLDFSGDILLVSSESTLPYDRPPLSKDFLLRRVTEDEIGLVSESQWSELGVEVILGCAATAVDLRSRRLIAGGQEIEYDRLVVATGARPIELPMFRGFAGATYLRTLEDARSLREALSAGASVGIVGGGFIGLEVAAAATQLGCQVTVVEAAAEPLVAVLGPEMGAWIRAWHERRGVSFCCGSPVSDVEGVGRVECLHLADRTAIDVDLAVIGVGVRPNIEWLADSGLDLHRGLVCDPHGRTSDPHVFGAGDVTCRHRDGGCAVTGHWTAASDQGGAAAEAVVGAETDEVVADESYFWSDQFGKRFQFSGSVPAGARTTVVKGSLTEESYVVHFDSAGVLTGVLALDAPRDFVRASLALRKSRVAIG